MTCNPEFRRRLYEELFKPTVPWPVCPKDHKPIIVKKEEGAVYWACSERKCDHARPGYRLQ